MLLDPSAEPGTLYYYAVFTERGGVCSHVGTTRGPLLRLAEVEELGVLGRDGSVELSWRLPAGAAGVEVWQMPDRPPAKRGQGHRLAVVQNAGAVDTGLSNDQIQGYRVVALFRGPNGQIIPSPGVTTTGVPIALPEVVTSLQVVRHSSDVEAAWEPPARGQVVVFVLPGPSKLPAGTLLPAAQLQQLGRRLSPLGRGRARGPADSNPVQYFLPVTVAGQTAIVGQGVTLSWIEEVDELQVRRQDDRLVCTWRWPAKHHTVVVAWRHDQFPSHAADPKAKRSQCERSQYERTNGFAMPMPEGDRLFLTVFTALKSADGWQYASAAAPGARCKVPLGSCRRLRYRFRWPGWLRRLFGSRACQLRITPDEAAILPALVLVARSGGIPFDRDDGSVVLTLHAGISCAPDRPYIKWVPVERLPPRASGRLFHVDPADADWVDLDREE